MKIPPGSGELILNITSEISSSFQLDDVNIRSIGECILGTTRKTLSPAFQELLIVEEGRLKNLEDSSETFEIDSKSLVGHIGESKMFQVITQPSRAGTFNGYSLAKPFEIFNVCGIPLMYSNSSTLYGVLMLYNSQCGLTYDHVNVAISIGSMFLGQLFMYLKSQKHTHFNSLTDNASEENSFEMLTDWIKQIFRVANSTEKKQILSRKILANIYTDPRPQVLINSAMQLITALINLEGTRLLYKSNSHSIAFQADESLVVKDFNEDDQLVFDYARPQPMFLRDFRGKENCALVKIKHEHAEIVFELSNKTDDTLRNYKEFSGSIQFTKVDENLVESIASPLFMVINAYLKEDPSVQIDPLRHKISEYLRCLNSFPIISSIRAATQELLNCDRGTVYLREEDKMIIAFQGNELDIPINFGIPLGKGIVGSMAQSGIIENIVDVYEDQRFNPDIDKMTGYRTKSMLCVPVFDNKKKVTAAIQMINSKKGFFNKEDETIISTLAEILGILLATFKGIQNNLEKTTELVAILNSIGNYVLVFDETGYLQYSNKSVEDFLGCNEGHFSEWLQNTTLANDLSTFHELASKKVQRKFEKVPINGKDFIFDYTILPFQDISSEKVGILLILEDTSEMQEISSKYKEAMETLQNLTTEPVTAQNSLQSCIVKLEGVLYSTGISSEIYKNVVDTIATLKRGNLNKAVVILPEELTKNNRELTNRITEYNDDAAPVLKIEQISRVINTEKLHSSIPELMDWSLDIHRVADHFHYIFQMLDKFDLLTQFTICSETLHTFTDEISRLYEERGNPYHNFYHGISVMHSSFLLLCPSYSHFNSHEILSILVASMCHDVGHTGFTNMFEVTSQSYLATLYNDQSVLENHHAALTFQVLKKEECNIFKRIPVNEFRVMRKQIVEAILSTDMGKHFRMIADMNSRFSSISDIPIGTYEDDIQKLGGLIVHCADLAHPTKKYEVYANWSALVCKEFTQQVEREIEMGFPPTEFMMGLDDPARYYRSEIGFMSAVVKPLWNCMHLWIDMSDKIINLDRNLEIFQNELAKIEG